MCWWWAERAKMLEMNFKYFIDGVRDSLESQSGLRSPGGRSHFDQMWPRPSRAGNHRNPHRNILEGRSAQLYVCESRSRAEHVNDLGDKQTIDWYLGAAVGQTLSHCLKSPGKLESRSWTLWFFRFFFGSFNLFCSFVTRAKTQISVRFMQLRK